jgi:hypothetical protein
MHGTEPMTSNVIDISQILLYFRTVYTGNISADIYLFIGTRGRRLAALLSLAPVSPLLTVQR